MGSAITELTLHLGDRTYYYTYFLKSLKCNLPFTRGRWHKQLLDDFKQKGRYCNMKEEALDRILWRTGFGMGCGPVVRQTAE